MISSVSRWRSGIRSGCDRRVLLDAKDSTFPGGETSAAKRLARAGTGLEHLNGGSCIRGCVLRDRRFSLVHLVHELAEQEEAHVVDGALVLAKGLLQDFDQVQRVDEHVADETE